MLCNMAVPSTLKCLRISDVSKYSMFGMGNLIKRHMKRGEDNQMLHQCNLVMACVARGVSSAKEVGRLLKEDNRKVLFQRRNVGYENNRNRYKKFKVSAL
jgi:hypothetical protein